MYRILEKISLNALRLNATRIKEFTNKKLIAVVKDDAYGHGAEAVCHALEDVADLFAVASVEEGAALRTAGITKDILVLTPCLSKEEGVRLIAYGLIASVSSLASLRVMLRAEAHMHSRARVHVAVNTGMNRYGVRQENLLQVLREAGERVEGVYSHLYSPSDRAVIEEQVRIFQEARDRVRGFVPRAVCHLSATGGALAGVESDAVRAGIALYGYLPAGFEGALAVTPVAKFYATVAHSCRQVGRGVGYNLPAQKYRCLHTLRAGYGDGFFRAGGEPFLGVICMDAALREGRERFGRRKLILNNVTQYAKAIGTSEYEVLVRLGSRAEKRYIL